MKSTYRIMALVAGLALWGTVPAGASATTPVWHLNAGPLTEASSTSWKGTVTMTDAKVPLLGSQTEQCEDTAEGTVTSKGLGEVTHWTSSNCKSGAGKAECENSKPIALAAVHLPWRVELTTVEGAIHAVIGSSGAGVPGFTVKCKVVGINAEDTCTGTLTTATTNVSGGVMTAFKPAEKLTCVQGGVGSGTLEGSQTIGAGVSKLSTYAEHEPPEWAENYNPLTGSHGASVEGSVILKTSSVDGGVIVACEDRGGGKVGSKGAGEFTTLTTSNCKKGEGYGANACIEGSSMTIEAENLPWTTELAIVGGVTEDRIVSSGKGEPIFKMKCAISAGSFTAECRGLPALSVESTYPNAVANYGPDEPVKCNPGGTGTVSGSQTISLDSDGLLEAI